MNSNTIIVIVFVMLLFVAIALLARWVYYDARSRNMRAILWTFLCISFPGFIILYLIIRKKESRLK